MVPDSHDIVRDAREDLVCLDRSLESGRDKPWTIVMIASIPEGVSPCPGIVSLMARLRDRRQDLHEQEVDAFLICDIPHMASKARKVPKVSRVVLIVSVDHVASYDSRVLARSPKKFSQHSAEQGTSGRIPLGLLFGSSHVDVQAASLCIGQ